MKEQEGDELAQHVAAADVQNLQSFQMRVANNLPASEKSSKENVRLKRSKLRTKIDVTCKRWSPALARCCGEGRQLA